MLKPYRSPSFCLGVALLLSILCLDSITWCIDDPTKLLVCNAISIGLKLWFILLSISRYFCHKAADHAKGLIGVQSNSEKSISPIKLTTIVIRSLIAFNCLTKLHVSMVRCQGSVLATVSCIMGLSSCVVDPSLQPQLPHFGFLNSDMNLKPVCKYFKRVIDPITNFSFKRFVWHIIQSAPGVLLDISMWSLVYVGIAHCCGALIQLHHVIIISCLALSSIATAGVCFGYRVPLKPFAGYCPEIFLFQFLVTCLTACPLLCIRAPSCDRILIIGMLCAVFVASILVMVGTHAREYNPSELKLEVVTTSYLWDGLIAGSIGTGILFLLASGLNMSYFNESVKDFARIQAQGGNFNAQDPQCVKDLNQCITAINGVQMFYNQSAIPLPQFDLGGRLDLDGQLVGREDQAAKGPWDHVTHELKQHIQTLFNPFAPISPFLDAYKIISDKPQCVSALIQFEHGTDQPGRNKQIGKDHDNFLDGFDKFVKDYNKSKNYRWAIVPFIVVPTICHLPYVGKQVFMFKFQGNVRDLWVNSGEKYFKNKYPIIRTIVELILTRYPISFILASVLCVLILCGWSKYSKKQSIVLVILAMLLMFVIGSTSHEMPETASVNPDPEGTELVPIPNADASQSITSLEAPLEEPSTNSSAPTAPSLDTLTPGSEDPVQSSMASTESSAPSHSRGNLVNHLEGSSTQSLAPATVPELSSSGNASQSGDSSVQHPPSSSTGGFPKSGSSNS